MRGRGGAAGQSTVEFALILPVFLMIAVGTIQFGQVFFNYAKLLRSTQEGARYGTVMHNTDNQITARVRQVSPGGNADGVSIATTLSPTNNGTTSAANRGPGNVVTVTGTHAQGAGYPIHPPQLDYPHGQHGDDRGVATPRAGRCSARWRAHDERAARRSSRGERDSYRGAARGNESAVTGAVATSPLWSKRRSAIAIAPPVRVRYSSMTACW